MNFPPTDCVQVFVFTSGRAIASLLPYQLLIFVTFGLIVPQY